MMMSSLHLQARRILAYSSRSSLLRRSYNTLRSHIKTDLEKWLKHGNQLKPSYVRGLIKNLRDTNHFSQALEWMCEQRVFNTFPEDYAARLHLVDTVLGLEEAKKFFKSIPENMRDYSVYDILLRSYTKSEKTLDKAESTFEKMRDLGFLLKPYPYNSMISLYAQLEKQDMVEKLQHELKENNVEVDSINVLNVGKIKEKSKTSVDEKVRKPVSERIIAMEKAYVEAGSIEKAIEMYGGVPGSNRELYHLWDEYKKEGKMSGYRSVISSLLKLDDVQGAEKIYGEWEPYGPDLDMSIPESLISRFRAEGNESKAKEVVKSIRKKRIMMNLTFIAFGLVLLGVIIIMALIPLSIMKLLTDNYPIFYWVFCGYFIKHHPMLFFTKLGYVFTSKNGH